MYSPAEFIGADGSCGLKHGQSYMIKISNHPRRYYVHVKGRFGIPYDTIDAIKNNWKLPPELLIVYENDFFEKGQGLIHD